MGPISPHSTQVRIPIPHPKPHSTFPFLICFSPSGNRMVTNHVVVSPYARTALLIYTYKYVSLSAYRSIFPVDAWNQTSRKPRERGNVTAVVQGHNPAFAALVRASSTANGRHEAVVPARRRFGHHRLRSPRRWAAVRCLPAACARRHHSPPATAPAGWQRLPNLTARVPWLRARLLRAHGRAVS